LIKGHTPIFKAVAYGTRSELRMPNLRSQRLASKDARPEVERSRVSHDASSSCLQRFSVRSLSVERLRLRQIEYGVHDKLLATLDQQNFIIITQTSENSSNNTGNKMLSGKKNIASKFESKGFQILEIQERSRANVRLELRSREQQDYDR
jgi:hypothetical protein